MRIRAEEAAEIVDLVLSGLREGGLVEFKSEEARVRERMREALLEDMRAEDELDREVEALLESHMNEMDGRGVDYRKMFRMLKQRLARERGMVI